MARQYAADLLH